MFDFFASFITSKCNVIIINNDHDQHAKVEEVNDSKIENLTKQSESHFVMMFSNFTSKFAFYTYQLRTAAKKTKKRRKINENVSNSNSFEFITRDVEANESSKLKRKTRLKKKKKILKFIVDMLNKEKINISNILMSQIITFSIMHLYALFSFFKNEVKRFTTVFRKFRIKRVSKNEKVEKFKEFDVKKAM